MVGKWQDKLRWRNPEQGTEHNPNVSAEEILLAIETVKQQATEFATAEIMKLPIPNAITLNITTAFQSTALANSEVTDRTVFEDLPKPFVFDMENPSDPKIKPSHPPAQNIRFLEGLVLDIAQHTGGYANKGLDGIHELPKTLEKILSNQKITRRELGVLAQAPDIMKSMDDYYRNQVRSSFVQSERLQERFEKTTLLERQFPAYKFIHSNKPVPNPDAPDAVPQHLDAPSIKALNLADTYGTALGKEQRCAAIHAVLETLIEDAKPLQAAAINAIQMHQRANQKHLPAPHKGGREGR
jgi:hypothetical protein